MRRKHGFQAPLDPHQVSSFILFLGFVAGVFAFYLPVVEDEAIKWFLLGLYAFALIIVVTLNILTGFTDPSDPGLRGDKDGEFWCSLCQVSVRGTSKHCRACDRCVDKFDHHCKWLNNCVGARNYWYFFSLVCTTASLLCIQLGWGVWIFICSFTRAPQIRALLRKSFKRSVNFIGWQVAMALYMLVLAASILMLGELLVFHLVLIYKDLTTYDYIVMQKEAKVNAAAAEDPNTQPSFDSAAPSGGSGSLNASKSTHPQRGGVLSDLRSLCLCCGSNDNGGLFKSGRVVDSQQARPRKIHVSLNPITAFFMKIPSGPTAHHRFGGAKGIPPPSGTSLRQNSLGKKLSDVAGDSFPEKTWYSPPTSEATNDRNGVVGNNDGDNDDGDKQVRTDVVLNAYSNLSSDLGNMIQKAVNEQQQQLHHQDEGCQQQQQQQQQRFQGGQYEAIREGLTVPNVPGSRVVNAPFRSRLNPPERGGIVPGTATPGSSFRGWQPGQQPGVGMPVPVPFPFPSPREGLYRCAAVEPLSAPSTQATAGAGMGSSGRREAAPAQWGAEPLVPPPGPPFPQNLEPLEGVAYDKGPGFRPDTTSVVSPALAVAVAERSEQRLGLEGRLAAGHASLSLASAAPAPGKDACGGLVSGHASHISHIPISEGSPASEFGIGMMQSSGGRGGGAALETPSYTHGSLGLAAATFAQPLARVNSADVSTSPTTVRASLLGARSGSGARIAGLLSFGPPLQGSCLEGEASRPAVVFSDLAAEQMQRSCSGMESHLYRTTGAPEAR